MDKKVVGLLIDRIIESSINYELHKNDAWKECLESDKERLKAYVEKYVFEPEPEPKPKSKLPDFFNFIYGENKKKIFRAVREGNYFMIYWDDDKELKIKSRRYSEREVSEALGVHLWKIVD